MANLFTRTLRRASAQRPQARRAGLQQRLALVMHAGLDDEVVERAEDIGIGGKRGGGVGHCFSPDGVRVR